MTYQLKQISVRQETPSLWRVAFNHPPINLVDHETLRELDQVTSDLEASAGVKAVIFESENADFFLAHWDTASVPSARPGSPEPSWLNIGLRLAQMPVISIALIRGRARGIGSEIALGCDMRFASIENAILGQPEVGVGLVPGGGAMERLPMLIGRARAIEIVVGADDFDAATAERYGWINRALPDLELDEFVLGLARRIASFDKQAVTAAKRIISRDAIPSAEKLKESQATFAQAFTWPETKARAKRCLELGMNKPGDFEMRLGEYLPTLAPDVSRADGIRA
jgi:enoyl-CoA hydratase/carnithine racemase